MNAGDKVRVIKRGPYFGKEGVFESWQRVPGSHGTPFCSVRFNNEVLYFDAWDLEPVEEVPEPNPSKTCDFEFTTGRRFIQTHTCTLPVSHTQDFHYCSICGQEYLIESLTLKYRSKEATHERG